MATARLVLLLVGLSAIPAAWFAVSVPAVANSPTPSPEDPAVNSTPTIAACTVAYPRAMPAPQERPTPPPYHREFTGRLSPEKALFEVHFPVMAFQAERLTVRASGFNGIALGPLRLVAWDPERAPLARGSGDSAVDVTTDEFPRSGPYTATVMADQVLRAGDVRVVVDVSYLPTVPPRSQWTFPDRFVAMDESHSMGLGFERGGVASSIEATWASRSLPTRVEMTLFDQDGNELRTLRAGPSESHMTLAVPDDAGPGLRVQIHVAGLAAPLDVPLVVHTRQGFSASGPFNPG